METKIEATDRLRREGRWEEASKYRETERQNLRAGGTPRQEANEKSWLAMTEKFAPLPIKPAPEPSPVVATDDIPFEQNTTPNLYRDILWAYERLDRKSTATVDAPSAGAWHMLVWARENRSKFFDTMLVKAMARVEECPECQQRGKGSAQAISDHDQSLIELCQQFEGKEMIRQQRS